MSTSPIVLPSRGVRGAAATTVAVWWDPSRDRDIPPARALRWAAAGSAARGVVHVSCARAVRPTLGPTGLRRLVAREMGKPAAEVDDVRWLEELPVDEQLAARRGWRVVRADPVTAGARAGAVITLGGEVTVVTHPDCTDPERAHLIAWAEEQVDLALARPHAAPGWSAWPHSWQILHRGETR